MMDMNIAAIYRAVLVRGEKVRIARSHGNVFMAETWPLITTFEQRYKGRYYAEVTNPNNEEHHRLSVETYCLTPRHSGYPERR